MRKWRWLKTVILALLRNVFPPVALRLSFVYNDARLHLIKIKFEEFPAMRSLIIVSLLLCLPCATIAQRRRPQSQPRPKTPPKEQKIFPYQYTIDELPNGLHLIT